MFSGIVEERGEVIRLQDTPTGASFDVRVSFAGRDGGVAGDSVAINGCCLTVTGTGADYLQFDLLAETRRVTNLAGLRVSAPVNIERSLRADGRIGGHFVSGHIDTTGEILTCEPRGNDRLLEVGVEHRFRRYLAPKGCIAVDGISLTVAGVTDSGFTVWLIPYTREMTTLGSRSKGERVNLEFDLLAKYVERILNTDQRE